MTDLASSGLDRFAGVIGAVTGGRFEKVRYRVNSDYAGALVPAAGFGAVGSELSNNPSLTLTGAGSPATGLSLGGAA